MTVLQPCSMFLGVQFDCLQTLLKFSFITESSIVKIQGTVFPYFATTVDTVFEQDIESQSLLGY